MSPTPTLTLTQLTFRETIPGQQWVGEANGQVEYWIELLETGWRWISRNGGWGSGYEKVEKAQDRVREDWERQAAKFWK